MSDCAAPIRPAPGLEPGARNGPASGDFAARDHECDEVIWAPASEALAQLTFETERSILEQALATLGEHS